METEVNMLDRLDHLVDEIGGLHSKLILLVGGPGLGKTALLAELANRRTVRVLSVGSTLGNRLAALPQKQRPLKAPAVLREITGETGDLVLLNNMSALQGNCTSAEVHRRMSEVYGEREGTYRMTNMVLQSQASWGAIERVEKGTRLVRKPSIVVSQPEAVAWLTEAALRYLRRSVSLSTLQSLSVLHPFVLDQPLAYMVSRSANLELRVEGAGNQFVCLNQR
jgi:hypothetical protein